MCSPSQNSANSLRVSCSSSLPPAILLFPHSLRPSRAFPRRCARSSSFLEEESFGTPIRLSCDAYASDSHNECFFERREQRHRARATIERQSRYTFKAHIYICSILSRRLDQRKTRADSLLWHHGQRVCTKYANDKENDRAMARQLRQFRRRFAESGRRRFPVSPICEIIAATVESDILQMSDVENARKDFVPRNHFTSKCQSRNLIFSTSAIVGHLTL